MKNISFLCGMPRSGNTLLGALINQNKKVVLTANSVVPDILHETWKVKHTMSFQNFPDNDSFDKYLENIIQKYYSSFEQKFIIDRGPWGTPGNLMLLQKYYKHQLNFIVLTRDVLECMASFINIMKIEKNKIEKTCENFLNRTEMLGLSIWSIQNLIKESKTNSNIKIHFLTYENLIKNPLKEIKKIFDFLKIPSSSINLKNFDDFSVNSIKYNDAVWSDIYHTNLHDIRTNCIKKNKMELNKILPKKIINKYKNVRLF